MKARVSFHDDRWECEPITVAPEEHLILKNEDFTIIEYVVKVATVRCYYNENTTCDREVKKYE